MACANAGGWSIDEHPAGADSRTGYGHREMDTVPGGTRKSPVCLLVLTERVTRLEIIRKIPGRLFQGPERPRARLGQHLPHPAPADLRQRVRVPRQPRHREVLPAKKERYRVCFIPPCSPSEKGSNGNANRIIRHLIPKGADNPK